MTDERLDAVIGRLLRGGVTAAAAVALAGGAWLLAASGGAAPHYGKFVARVTGLRSMGALAGPEAAVMAGLLLLIATPVARVALTLAVFAMRRDRTYTLVTLAVLAALLYSLGTSWL
ncbi:MAG TPA: DUF1634 domain-containing protein [Bryobacteraceae bacterium]|nr:DUF1634 domain-containing protein [Bryobacteraceae bacterium]